MNMNEEAPTSVEKTEDGTRDEDARALHSNDWSPVSVKSTYASIYLFSGSSNDVPRDGKCQISAFNCVVLCCETILTTSN